MNKILDARPNFARAGAYSWDFNSSVFHHAGPLYQTINLTDGNETELKLSSKKVLTYTGYLFWKDRSHGFNDK